jgi:hypothetical protein
VAEDDGDGDVCLPPDISADNESHKEYSIVTIEVKGYPGMFRVIAWVLNGLMLDVHNATLQTSDDGVVTNKFWLTDIKGSKLSDSELATVADRLTDYVANCTPDNSMRRSEKLSFANVTVDNSLDDKLSVITIFAPQQRQERLPRNALLEIASCINGCGIKIYRAVIQSCSDCGVPVADDDFAQAEKTGTRLYKIWGTDRADKKLDYGRASALIYTLNLLYSPEARSGSTTPPRPLV